jgi:hypothetical protein
LPTDRNRQLNDLIEMSKPKGRPKGRTKGKPKGKPTATADL